MLHHSNSKKKIEDNMKQMSGFECFHRVTCVCYGFGLPGCFGHENSLTVPTSVFVPRLCVFLRNWLFWDPAPAEEGGSPVPFSAEEEQGDLWGSHRCELQGPTRSLPRPPLRRPPGRTPKSQDPTEINPAGMTNAHERTHSLSPSCTHGLRIINK